jgi:hypothetical protein
MKPKKTYCHRYRSTDVFLYGTLHVWYPSCMVPFMYGTLHVWYPSCMVSFMYGTLHVWYPSCMVLFLYGTWYPSCMVPSMYGTLHCCEMEIQNNFSRLIFEKNNQIPNFMKTAQWQPSFFRPETDMTYQTFVCHRAANAPKDVTAATRVRADLQ